MKDASVKKRAKHNRKNIQYHGSWTQRPLSGQNMPDCKGQIVGEMGRKKEKRGF